MRRFLPALLCTLALAACASTPHPAPTLVGRWTPVTAQLSGQDYPASNFQGATLVLTASTYDFGGDQGTVSVNATTAPAQMDIHGTVGPNAGRTILAIYRLTTDQLTICYNLSAGPRPSDFVSPAGSMVLLVHYQRTQP